MENYKESIIEAARKSFAKYGYSKTTLEDIGRGVGLKKNSLYHYFKNKEEIFMLVVKKEINHLIDDFKKKYDPLSGFKKIVLDYLKQRLERCKQPSVFNTLLTDLYLSQNPILNEVTDLAFKVETSFLESIFINAYKNKEIPQKDFKKYANSLLLISDSIKRLDYHKNLDPEPSEKPNLDEHIIFIAENLLLSMTIKNK